LTNPVVADLLAEVEGSPLASADSAKAVNVRLWRRAHDRACRLPRSLVEEIAQTASMAQQQWASARRRDDFARLLPWLEKSRHP